MSVSCIEKFNIDCHRRTKVSCNKPVIMDFFLQLSSLVSFDIKYKY